MRGRGVILERKGSRLERGLFLVRRRGWSHKLYVGFLYGLRGGSLTSLESGCSLEGLMLKLKLQYFGHLMQRADSLEKTLTLGKIEDRRRRGRQRM